MGQIPWINAARGLAIFLVMLHHAVQWADSAGYLSDVWLNITWALATIRLPLFFAIAGMLAVKWMRRPIVELLRSKVATLVWLFLLWQVFTVLSYMIVPNVSTPGKSNFRELMTAAATPVLPQNSLWFIWALALFFILGRALFERVPAWAVMVPAAAVCSLTIAGVLHTGNLGWDGALSNFIFFTAGIYGKELLRSFAAILNTWTAFAVIAGWVACMVFMPAIDGVGINIFTRALGLAAGISLGVLLQNWQRLAAVGRETLVYYLPHYIILGVLAFVTSVSGLPSSAAIWVPPVLFGVTILVCIGLRWAARRLRCEGWLYEGAPGRLLAILAGRRQGATSAAHEEPR
ncbi:acyltransferase [Arthrobacter sp. Z1-9]